MFVLWEVAKMCAVHGNRLLGLKHCVYFCSRRASDFVILLIPLEWKVHVMFTSLIYNIFKSSRALDIKLIMFFLYHRWKERQKFHGAFSLFPLPTNNHLTDISVNCRNCGDFPCLGNDDLLANRLHYIQIIVICKDTSVHTAVFLNSRYIKQLLYFNVDYILIYYVNLYECESSALLCPCSSP